MCSFISTTADCPLDFYAGLLMGHASFLVGPFTALPLMGKAANDLVRQQFGYSQGVQNEEAVKRQRNK